MATKHTLMALIHHHAHGDSSTLFLVEHDSDGSLPGLGNEFEVAQKVGVAYDPLLAEEIEMAAVVNLPPHMDMKMFVEMGLPVVKEAEYSDMEG